MGADGEWFRGLVAVLFRSAALIGLAGAAGAAVASIGRNTSTALGAAFGYLVVFEGILRGWKPWTQRWLVGNNAASFVEGHAPRTSIGRGATAAGVLLVVYAVVLSAAAIALFRQRDVAA